MGLPVAVLSLLLPWRLRRRLLNCLDGVELSPGSRIGFSLVAPRERLVLEEGARIGHLNLIRKLDTLHLGRNAEIGAMNWISATLLEGVRIFDEYPDRRPELVLGECASITRRHFVDCTDSVRLDRFAVLGGLRTTVLSHQFDIHRGRQGCAPIQIGAFSLVSTECLLLAGSRLPDRSILGARALLATAFDAPYWLYAGSPAKPMKEYPPDLPFFHRSATKTY